MSWNVEGTYFENCNCDFACPCSVTSFASPATQDRCQVVLAYHIQRGQIDVEDYVPEGFSEPTKLVGVFHPSNTTLTMARPTESRIKAFGMEFHNSGKSAFSAPYRWSA